jgi:hypothetical protein
MARNGGPDIAVSDGQPQKRRKKLNLNHIARIVRGVGGATGPTCGLRRWGSGHDWLRAEPAAEPLAEPLSLLPCTRGRGTRGGWRELRRLPCTRGGWGARGVVFFGGLGSFRGNFERGSHDHSLNRVS